MTDELSPLEFIKENRWQYTQQQLADLLGLSFNEVRWIISHHRISLDRYGQGHSRQEFLLRCGIPGHAFDWARRRRKIDPLGSGRLAQYDMDQVREWIKADQRHAHFTCFFCSRQAVGDILCPDHIGEESPVILQDRIWVRGRDSYEFTQNLATAVRNIRVLRGMTVAQASARLYISANSYKLLEGRGSKNECGARLGLSAGQPLLLPSFRLPKTAVHLVSHLCEFRRVFGYLPVTVMGQHRLKLDDRQRYVQTIAQILRQGQGCSLYTGLSPDAVRHYEQGKIRDPRFKTLHQLFRAKGLDLQIVFERQPWL